MPYFSQIALLKMYAYMRFAYVRFQVLKITKHPEEGAIKCRWRIVGAGGFRVCIPRTVFCLDYLTG